MFTCLWRLVSRLVVLGVILYGLNVWIRVKDYHFDKNEIHKLAKPFVGQSGIQAAAQFGKALRKRYGDLILENAANEWVFFKAGGSPGAACVFYASLTEYVLIYGTEIGGSGYSGRLWANISDTILQGTLRKWSESTLQVEEIGPGTLTEHLSFDTAFVTNSPGIWMVEYARGFIPSMFPFLVADNIFSSADPLCLVNVFRVFGKCVLHDFGRTFGLF